MTAASNFILFDLKHYDILIIVKLKNGIECNKTSVYKLICLSD